jgi:neutral ceramidase
MKMIRLLFVVLATKLIALPVASFAAVGSPSPKSPQFRAGAAASNVTPPLGVSLNGGFHDRHATHVHDELHARCLVLDDSQIRLALVVVDNCVLQRAVIDDAKQQIHAATGLPLENLLISATHAHSCPTVTPVGQSEPDPAYNEWLATRIADGVRRAINNLAPARIGWGHGEVPGQVFNRRWKLKPGTMPVNPFGNTNDLVKMNPGMGSPNLVEPAGPTDPQVWFISVQSPEGRPVALLANYSLHYVGGVPGTTISADYFGAFADRIQELLGADRTDPPFVGLMSNGTSGDINNVDFRGGQPKQPPYGQMRLVANEVAQEVARVLKTISYHDTVSLGSAQKEIQLGVRHASAAELEKAREVMNRSRSFPRMDTMEEVYAREAVLLSEYPPQMPAVLQVLKIGDLRICAIPAEVFVEIGLELKARRPNLFAISLANGYNGYLPTPEQHALGGYETWRARSAYLEVNASRKIVATLAELLAQLK